MECKTALASGTLADALISIAPCGVAVYRADDGQCIFANEQIARIAGTTREVALGQRFREIDSWRASGMTEAAERALGSGEMVRQEVRVDTSYGKLLWLDNRFARIEVDGQPHLMLSTIDISETRAAEELKRSNAELRQFAYVVSHDLREPLRVISGFLGLLERRYGDAVGKDGKEYIEFAVDGARRMNGLIDDLLALSRIDTRAEPARAVKLDSALDGVERDLRLALEESSAELRRVGVLSELTVLADESQLRVLLQNLLANALKFCGEAPPKVEIGAEVEGQLARVWVRDEGLGIEEKDQGRIFEVLQRLHGPNEYPGNGIGLAICRRIVERHGGTLEVRSTPGEGSTFSFVVPLAREAGEG
jgi:PAS domain S-box-containing protein